MVSLTEPIESEFCTIVPNQDARIQSPGSLALLLPGDSQSALDHPF